MADFVFNPFGSIDALRPAEPKQARLSESTLSDFSGTDDDHDILLTPEQRGWHLPQCLDTGSEDQIMVGAIHPLSRS
jgi:hypothetical protein